MGVCYIWNCNPEKFTTKFSPALSSGTAFHILRLPKSPNHYTFTLKMETAMFAETLDNSIFGAAHPQKPKIHDVIICFINIQTSRKLGKPVALCNKFQ
jgi:hypothetical protein